jgi:hypothetical protein
VCESNKVDDVKREMRKSWVCFRCSPHKGMPLACVVSKDGVHGGGTDPRQRRCRHVHRAVLECM